MEEDNINLGIDSFQFQEESINNLITKGDQKDLLIFKEENKILCIDDDKLEEDISRRAKALEDILLKNYKIFQKDSEKIEKIDSENFDKKIANITNEDQILFDTLLKKLQNKEDDNKFKCFVL